MSFILDALDKIEEEKNHPSSEPVSRVEGGRAFTERQRFAVSFAAVAVAAAMLSLVVFVWVQWQREREQRLALQASAGVDASAVTPTATPEMSQTWPSAGTRFTSSPPKTRQTRRAVLPPVQLDPLGDDEFEPNEGQRHNDELEGVTARAVDPPAQQVSAIPPMRLVGNRSSKPRVRDTAPAVESTPRRAAPVVAQPTPQVQPSAEISAPAAVAEAASEPTSSQEFSLQGTSVIDGKSVAVVNDTRVFEGDWIDGARVLRISEREVELDHQGKRLTLTL